MFKCFTFWMLTICHIVEPQQFLCCVAHVSVVVGKLGHISSWWHSWAWSLDSIYICVCVCLWICGGCRGIQGSVHRIVLYCCRCCEVSTFLPPCQSAAPTTTATSTHTTHPSLLTGLAHSGNRRSPNPSMTPQPTGSGLSIVTLCWAAPCSRSPCCRLAL